MKDKLNKLNFLAESMMSNTRRTTPRLALVIMYDLPPLHFVVIQEAISAMARNRTVIIKDWPGCNKKHRTLIGHILYWEKQAKQLGLKIDDTDALKADKWKKHYKVNLDSFTQVGPPIHNQINIYTDGSKTDDHVGSGYVIYHKGEELMTHSRHPPAMESWQVDAHDSMASLLPRINLYISKLITLRLSLFSLYYSHCCPPLLEKSLLPLFLNIPIFPEWSSRGFSLFCLCRNDLASPVLDRGSH